MAHYVDLTKNKISDHWDWPNCPNDILFSRGRLRSQGYETTSFQTSSYVTPRLNYRLKINHPFREFFIGGVYKRPCQKGRTLVLLKRQSPSRFPLINFLFLPGCSEKAMAPHSSTLAWKIPWMEESGRLQSMGSLRVGHNWVTSLSCIGEGNGNPLQCSCLENPRDGGAWWAAIHGVAQSRTRLKRLSSSSLAARLSLFFSALTLQ